MEGRNRILEDTVQTMKILDFKRIGNAFFYSMQGLRSAFKKETACQQELILLFILSPVAAFMPISVVEKILLISGLLIVLIVEILNTAVETVVNLVSPEKHPLAAYAKDLGSAAVFLSLLLCGMIWVSIIGTHYF